MPTSRPNPIDVHVGRRLRLRRTLLGMSQERLGELLDLTFQQIQKYERGANRIGSSRLYEIGRILDVPVAYFFEEIRHEPASPSSGAPSAARPAFGGLAEEASTFEAEPPDAPPPAAFPGAFEPEHLEKRETLELVRAYYRIRDPAVRRRLFELAKALGNLPAAAVPGDNA